MSGLRQADLRGAVDFLGEAAAVDGGEAFPPDILASLRRLVRCDYAFFSELDHERELVLGVSGYPVWSEPDPPLDYWEVRDEHPICRHHARTFDWRAYALTDFTTTREFHRRRIYNEWFRPCGVEHELAVGLDAPVSHTKVFIFDRGAGPDFAQREKALLDLLRPHLASLYRAAQRRRRLREALAALEHEAEAVLMLDGGDRIARATAAARELLERHGGGERDTLPAPIRSWLAGKHGDQTDVPLVLDTDAGVLVVRAEGGLLLLAEQSRAGPLTPREHQIMDRVAEGDTNAEIAAAFCLSPGTVRRHLENVYAKLGVHNRTSAVARLRLGGGTADGGNPDRRRSA
jgi:DNA-binding CsgD family transcriptional regulator